MALAQTASPPRDDLHVAIIMDGNGRWAKARGLPRSLGHKKGAEVLTDILLKSKQLGIRYLTLYAFSAENWNRPSDEVNDLMRLLEHYLERKKPLLDEHEIRLRVIGNLDRMEAPLRDKIVATTEHCRAHDSLHLTIALSYGGRQEIVTAAKQLARKVAMGELAVEEIDEAALSDALYTHELPEPDLLIRTGGEKRLSNFLLWQSAYTELFFTDIFWPDFTVEALRSALDDFRKRDRRYGAL